MIKAVSNYFASIPPMFLDGCLYVLIAIFTFLGQTLASDEAGKFISLQWLFYLKTFVGTVAAGALAVKLFRSTTYADHVSSKTTNGNGHNNGNEKTDTSIVTRLTT